jgi:anti-anti-sigma factor
MYYNSIHELIQEVKVIKNTCALSSVFYSALCGVWIMEFTYVLVNKAPVISFIRDDGSLLNSDVDVFGREVLDIIESDVYKVVFDLRKNSYLNSFGLGELINLRNYFLDKGITTVLIVTSKKIIKLFDMVGIGDLFETIESEKEI